MKYEEKMLILSKKLDQARNSAERHHMRRVLRDLDRVISSLERGKRP